MKVYESKTANKNYNRIMIGSWPTFPAFYMGSSECIRAIKTIKRYKIEDYKIKNYWF